MYRKKNNTYNLKIFYNGGILNNASHYLNFLTSCFGKPRQFRIINSTKIKKTKNDYNFNFVIQYNNAVAKFIYKENKINLEMILESKKISLNFTKMYRANSTENFQR